MNLFHEAKKVLDKDGKVNPMGPYGKQKLTGREVSTYFRRNKVSDPEVKKAVEVALDLGGADTIARKEIAKFYGSKILKSKEVQNALQYANEEVIIGEAYKLPNIKSSGNFSTLEIDGSKLKPKEKEEVMKIALAFNKGSRNNLHGQVEVNSGRVNPAMVKKASSLNQIRFSGDHDDLEGLKQDIAGGMKTIKEDYKKVIKMYPRDKDWKKLITKHKKAIDDFRNNNKDLPKKVEDDLIGWASQTGAVGHKDDVEDFITDILDENTITEKFKPYNDKNYPRCVDFYIQFRGGKGDRITSEENKKDFIKATDMIDAYCKKNKIKQKPVYSTPMEGSSAYKVGLMIDKSYSKTSDYDDGKDLQPLYVALSKLKTAEDHGGGWSVMVPKGLGPVKEDEVEEGKDKIKYRGNLKGLKEETISEGKNLMPAIEKIVDTKGAAKVGGVMLDMFTASMITTVYDKVNDQNKSRMEKSNIQTLVHIAHKVMGIKENLDEVTKQEVNAMKKLSKDMEGVKKGYNKIVGMGDKELKDTKYNEDYESILNARDTVLKLIGTLNNKMMLPEDVSKSFYHQCLSKIESMNEDIMFYRVKGMQKPEGKKFEQSAKLMGLKLTMDTRKKGMHKGYTIVAMHGSKKKLSDFDAVARGKSSYGDPSSMKQSDLNK
jgi:hypothetical protein